MLLTGLRSWILISTLGLLAVSCGSQVDRMESPPPPPASALNQFQLGNQAFEQQDYARAAHHFRRAREMDARQSEFHYNLGVALYRIGDFDAAAEAFDSALARDPNRSEAHYNLALTHYARYDLSAAHAHYNAYVRLAGGGSNNAVPVQQAAASTPNQGVASPAARPRRSPPGNSAARIGGARAQEPNPFEGNPEWWKEELPRQ